MHPPADSRLPSPALWALGLVILTVVLRLPALVHQAPIDDEAVYAVVGDTIVDGGRPYVDAIERKPPLIFWLYAAVFDVAGEYNWTALHAVAVVWVLLTMAGLYVVARRLFDWRAGLIAALLYSVFQPWGPWKNLAFNGELLMNLPLVWGWAIALAPGRSRYRFALVPAGMLLCAGFLLKQPAAIAAVPLGVYLLSPAYRAARGRTLRESVLHAALLTLGFFGALGGVALVLLRQGIVREAFYWTFTNHDVPHVFWLRGIETTAAFVALCLPLVVGAWVDRAAWDGRRAERGAIVGWLAVSAIGAAAGARFYPHYYIQLLPPLALLASPPFARLWREGSAYRRLPGPRVTWTWLAVTASVFWIAGWYGLRAQRVPETARYVRQHAGPRDCIFVWGQSAEVYLDARRPPASRYITTFPLTGFVFGPRLPEPDDRRRVVPGAWANLEHDLEARPPAYIVDTEIGARAASPAAKFPVIAALLEQSYRPVARTSDGVVYRLAATNRPWRPDVEARRRTENTR